MSKEGLRAVGRPPREGESDTVLRRIKLIASTARKCQFLAHAAHRIDNEPSNPRDATDNVWCSMQRIVLNACRPFPSDLS
jgi:hypothetical protein